MRARQLIGGATFPPDELRVIFEAFDGAWSEVAPDIGSDPGAIDTARVSLASILLSLATAGLRDGHGLRTAAVDSFRLKHGLK